jgi:hypothetical protein
VQSVRLVFTTRDWNPVSSAIRHAVPRSIFCPSLSSHCVIDRGDGRAAEATMLHKVREADLKTSLDGSRVVAERTYLVPHKDRGDAWLDKQIGKSYDFRGAFGLVKPDREWQKDDYWYCYELAAGYLINCGLDIFWDRGHITERELLGINPNLVTSIGKMMNQTGLSGATP